MRESILVSDARMLLRGHGLSQPREFPNSKKTCSSEQCSATESFARAIPGVFVRDKYLHVLHIWGNPNVFAVWRVFLQLNELSFYFGATESCK